MRVTRLKVLKTPPRSLSFSIVIDVYHENEWREMVLKIDRSRKTLLHRNKVGDGGFYYWWAPEYTRFACHSEFCSMSLGQNY